jgi:hypothetical protein
LFANKNAALNAQFRQKSNYFHSTLSAEEAAALSTDTITMMPLSGSFPKPISDLTALTQRNKGDTKNPWFGNERSTKKPGFWQRPCVSPV